MRIVVHGQQAFGKAVLEALLKRGDEVVAVYVAPEKPGQKADPLLGTKVRHPEYGVGTVVGVEGDEEDRRLSVSFPGRGTKKFVERYANLQQV